MYAYIHIYISRTGGVAPGGGGRGEGRGRPLGLRGAGLGAGGGRGPERVVGLVDGVEVLDELVPAVRRTVVLGFVRRA